jgi:hypothetical protein
VREGPPGHYLCPGGPVRRSSTTSRRRGHHGPYVVEVEVDHAPDETFTDQLLEDLAEWHVVVSAGRIRHAPDKTTASDLLRRRSEAVWVWWT